MPKFPVVQERKDLTITPGDYYAFIQSASEESVTLELIDADHPLLDNSKSSVAWRSDLRELWALAFAARRTENRIHVAERLAAQLHEFTSTFISLGSEQGSPQPYLHSENTHPLFWQEWHEDGTWLMLRGVGATSSTATIEAIHPVSPPQQALLKRIFSMTDWPSASAAEITSALNQIDPFGACLVLDVGQASANTFITQDGCPTLYFDAGAPLSHNIATAHTYCTHQDPLIILSHWHKDHWGGEQHNLELLTQTWIVPRQNVGPHQSQFATRILAAGGSILIMKRSATGRRSLFYKQHQIDLLLEYCTGPSGSLNNSGLALQICWPQAEEYWLFPGDADYRYVPQRMKAQNAPTLLVASHHGAAPQRRTTAPSPGPNTANRRLIYSYGALNTYSHPTQRAKDAHQQAKWAYPQTGYWGADVRATTGSATHGRCSIAVGVGDTMPPTQHLIGPDHNLTIRQ